GQCIVDAGQIWAGDRVDQAGARTFAPELDQERAVPVPEARGTLGIDRHRPGSGCEPASSFGQRLVGGDQGRQAVLRLEQRNTHECRLGRGSWETPGGASPQARASASTHPATCRSSLKLSRSSLAGDHDARISNSVVTGSSCFMPNPSVTTLVTEPL